MRSFQLKSEHRFHIPVMGLAFTIDSPIKVAKYGISSVVSILEVRLIEMMRKHYYPLIDMPYIPISNKLPDYKAKRVTDYLNLMNRIIKKQVETLKNEAFESGSDIVKYFEMLPKDSRLKKYYNDMLRCTDTNDRKEKENYLRTQIVAGSIDVNILTKTDRDNLDRNGVVISDGSDAVAALRGYLQSELTNSSIIFSAGLNPRLFSYMENFNTLNPITEIEFKKGVIIKVSDYRSALIQGKFLAKKGIWVDEFRIESGLNCGGHAFATDGYLLGPILEEFKNKKSELVETIFNIYKNYFANKEGQEPTEIPEIRISAQGGIGTYEEDQFLHEYYNISSTGWGTPFLLVPEATTVDEATLKLLCEAQEKDVILSHNSPLGVRFHYLKGTTADLEKQKRIRENKPGSPCIEKHLAFNTEFTTSPICVASKQYQKLKLAQLNSMDLPENELEKLQTAVLEKECLCVGLSNAASLVYDEPFLKNLNAVNVCPGPNIVNFSSIVSLKTMTDHIYGRTNIISHAERPHMFIAELRIYIKFLKERLLNLNSNIPDTKYFNSFFQNLNDAIIYYRGLSENFIHDILRFKEDLRLAEIDLAELRKCY